MDRPWVAIQRNPTSGAGPQRLPLLELIADLRRRGYRPCVFRDRAMLRRWLDDSRRRENLVCLVAAGGDGTVGDVLNRYPGFPVAILPAGTENLLARYLNIPASGAFVAAMIAEGSRRVLDLGVAESTAPPALPKSGGESSGDGSGQLFVRRFSIMASAGFDAEVIRLAHAARRGHITRFDYVQHIAQTLLEYSHPELRVWLDEEPEPRRVGLVVAMNLPAYALGLPVARDARGDDGLLDVRLFEHRSTLAMIRYFTAVAFGWHEQMPDVTAVRARRLRIESDAPVPVQCDGDPAGFTPATIRVLPGAVEVYTPGSTEERAF